MPFLQLINACESLADGEFTASDIAAPADFLMECLNAFLDPVACLAGQLLDVLLRPLMDMAMSMVPVLKDLWGSPEQIGKYAGDVQAASKSLASAANELVDGASDIPSWTGEAADAYHEVLRGLYNTIKDQSQSTALAADLLRAIGAVCAMIRELLWSLIKDFLSVAIRNAILALGSSVFSFGASIAAYMTWAAGYYAWVCGKVAHYMSKAFDMLSDITKKIGPLSRMLARIAETLRKVRAVQFGRAGGLKSATDNIRNNPRLAGNNVPDTANTGIPAAGADNHDDNDTSGNPSDSIRDFV